MTSDDFRNALDSLEHRNQREMRNQIQPILEIVKRIEREVVKTNGRVTSLEAHRIATDAATQARREATKEAAELVAEKAHEALEAHEKSTKWKVTVVSLGFTAISVGTPLMGALLRHLHVIHS